MNDAVMVAMIVAAGGAVASVPPTIAAVAALRQGRANGVKAQSNSDKSDVIIHKAEEIHTLTNSNLTKVTADLALANKRIEDLEKLVARMVGMRNDTQDR